MEESNLINNDNTYNTDMSTSQSTISGNATTNNKFNKDDLQEVTGGGGRGIVTQSTAIVYGTETSQTTETLTPILLILGDGTITDEEPVLLEEDEDITYKAVINSDYESNIPTINLEGSEVSYCDANYVIAVTETDKNIPVSYSSTNLSVSFTNNQDWCSVIFKSPLEVADQLKLPLNSDNFTDNSKIIVPVIKCTKNTGPKRNTTITFNIKSFAISHNIQMNVIQNKLEKLKPIMLYYDNGNYIKKDNCPQTFYLREHNDAITDSSLYVIKYQSQAEDGLKTFYTYYLNAYGEKIYIYLGYEDTNKIFTNKLSSVITTQVTTLESNTDGCSAKAYLIQNDNTGAPIKFSLNTCTQDRLITFSYKNTPIFRIQQTYKKELEIGDVLYSTADGKLTLDAQTDNVDNTPIAICVIPEVTENFKNGDDSAGAVKTARFVSLNYMNYNTPTTGNKDVQGMYFGNYGTMIGNTKGGIDKTSYVGGKWNTKRCVEKATNQDSDINAIVGNYESEGYCAPACCCIRYKTLGTKSGDWYLPMPGELYQIYANKTIINQKRIALVGEGFNEIYFYWSSREDSSGSECSVDLDNGNVGSNDKYDFNYVLGFLALEVPSFNIPSFKPSVNMEPVKLDSSSSKSKPEVGDVLYSTNDNKLTLDKTTNGVTNTAIAICVIKEVMENFKNGDDSAGAVKTARFVSLNYMNCDTPTTGSYNYQDIYFGNYGTTIGNVKGGTVEASYVGGKWNTQQCLSKTANQDPYIYAGVTNNIGEGYCAPACCCVAYSTPGTKSGDWYLPMLGELYQMYANKTIINQKRIALVGEGFSESYYYWSSREYSSFYEYYVYLDNGGIDYNSKNYDYYVLGFLALEV